MKAKYSDILEVLITSQLDQSSCVSDKEEHSDLLVNVFLRDKTSTPFVASLIGKEVFVTATQGDPKELLKCTDFNKFLRYIVLKIDHMRNAQAPERAFEVLIDSLALKNSDFDSQIAFALSNTSPLEGYMVSYVITDSADVESVLNIKWLSDYTIARNHDMALELFRLAHPQLNLTNVGTLSKNFGNQTNTKIYNPLTKLSVRIGSIHYASTSKHTSGNVVFDCKTMIYRHKLLNPTVKYIN